MDTITVEDRIAALPTTVNAADWLTRLGRFCTLKFVIQVDDTEFHIDVRSGRIADVQRGAFLLRGYAFAIRGAGASWAEFCREIPARGFQDLFAMTTYGHVQVDGDLDPLRQHLPYIKGVLAALRDTPSHDAQDASAL